MTEPAAPNAEPTPLPEVTSSRDAWVRWALRGTAVRAAGVAPLLALVVGSATPVEVPPALGLLVAWVAALTFLERGWGQGARDSRLRATALGGCVLAISAAAALAAICLHRARYGQTLLGEGPRAALAACADVAGRLSHLDLGLALALAAPVGLAGFVRAHEAWDAAQSVLLWVLIVGLLVAGPLAAAGMALVGVLLAALACADAVEDALLGGPSPR